jgi:translation initiation factor IF-3
MAHKEVGFQQVEKFIKETTPYGHPDAPAKLIGKGLNVMLSPLPRNKRAKNPRQAERDAELAAEREEEQRNAQKNGSDSKSNRISTNAAEQPSSSFSNNAFAKLDENLKQ